VAERESRHQGLALAFVLVAFCEEDSNAEETAESYANPLGLDEVVASLGEDFSQGFWCGDEDAGLIEEPAVVQNAVIWNIIYPISLGFTRWVFVNAFEMAKEKVGVL
jgi:hypothetical protein